MFFMLKFWQVSNITLKSSYRRWSIKKAVSKNFAIFIEKNPCWSLLFINMLAYKPATLLQRDSNIGAFLSILPNFLKHLFYRTPVSDCFWTLLIQSGSTNRKNRDVFRDAFRDDNWRRIQNPVKQLRWSFLQK